MPNLIAQKGYTITVKSWENDGDYRQTKKFVVETLDEVKRLHLVFKHICPSKNNSKSDYAIGNTYEPSQKTCDRIINFCDDFWDFSELEKEYEGEDEEAINDIKIERMMGVVEKLLGNSSDDFYCRVGESFKVTYSPKDISYEDLGITEIIL